MNKEKLKDYLIRVTYAYPKLEPESDERPTAEYKRGFNEALELAISKIDQLDEPDITEKQAMDKLAESLPLSVTQISHHLAHLMIYRGKVTYGELDEPEKVVVPESVAEWIKYVRGNREWETYGFVRSLIRGIGGEKASEEVMNYYIHNSEIVIRAWLAYPNIEVEKEPHPVLKAFDDKAEEYKSFESTYRRLQEVRKVVEESLEEVRE